MRITDQTPDLLRIVARKNHPVAGRLVVAGLIFTVPTLIGLVFSPNPDRIVSAVVFLGFIWFLLGISYMVTGGLSGPPTAAFDGITRRAVIDKHKYSLDDIDGVRQGHLPALVFDFRDGEETHFSVLEASTPAERERVVTAINAFLAAHRPERVARIAGEEFEEDDDPDANAEFDDYDRRLASAERWASRWTATAQASRRCVFCDSRTGDQAPIEINLSHRALPVHEKAYVPRCRHCARLHYLHGRVPLILAAFAFPATFVFCAVVLSERMTAGVAFGAAFIALILAVPIGVLTIGRLLTRPQWFGIKPVGAWEEQEELVRGRREGWTIQMSRSSRDTS
ncbi:MAG: hypothetical protein ACXV7D_08375 [Thermoanaerobaculia bacterium]